MRSSGTGVPMTHARKPGVARRVEQRLRVAAAHLHDGAELLGEQRGERRRAMPSSAISRPQRDANAISASVANSRRRRRRDRRGACRPDASAGSPRRARRARAGLEVRRVVAELPVDLRERRAAEPALAAARVEAARSAVSPTSSRSSGVSVARASATGANAETMSDTGAVTALVAARRRATSCASTSSPCRPGSRRRARRRSRSRPRARCRTARRPRRDGRRGAIQFADSLTSASDADGGGREVGDRLGDRHAPRRGRVDQRERRALADRHRLAGVARRNPSA